MLKISQKLEYAMRAMIELAQRKDEGVLVPAREIAERQQIPLRFLEQQLGVEAKWEDPLLSKLGAVDANGVPNGAAMSFGDFTKAVRTDPRFWQSPTAANDTYGLFNKINQTFNGRGA
jgi:hypothetical protein